MALGMRLMGESLVFSIMAGWIAEVPSMLFYAYTAVKWTEHGCV